MRFRLLVLYVATTATSTPITTSIDGVTAERNDTRITWDKIDAPSNSLKNDIRESSFVRTSYFIVITLLRYSTYTLYFYSRKIWAQNSINNSVQLGWNNIDINKMKTILNDSDWICFQLSETIYQYSCSFFDWFHLFMGVIFAHHRDIPRECFCFWIVLPHVKPPK